MAKKNKAGKYEYTFGKKHLQYKNFRRLNRANGFVDEYWNDQSCYSTMVNIPGTQLLKNHTLGVAYLIFLLYLFLGISIVADIFMEAIEEITSKVEVKLVTDTVTGEQCEIEFPVWNATMANLTLMAFGSSAPEILLSVSEACQSLGKPASPLGAATIVGSAAFNLMVISAVSVAANKHQYDDKTWEVKWIDDMGVFAVTGFFSIFAYVWMAYCLIVNTPDEVSRSEAFWTFGFMIILLVIAYCFDKINQAKKTAISDDEKREDLERKKKKTTLRKYARERGQETVIQVAQGITNSETVQISPKEQKEIIECFQVIIGTENLGSCNVNELIDAVKPDQLFERFAFRKEVAMGNPKDFLDIKGEKYQLEMKSTSGLKNLNPDIGFKCLHYSVSESSGFIEIMIDRKNPNSDVNFFVRTIEETAKASENYNTFE
jgi:Ca2+/Na+ antiporter